MAEDVSVIPENVACLEAVGQLGITGTKVSELEGLMRQPVPGQSHVAVRLRTRALHCRRRLRHMAANGHLPSEIFLAQLEDRVSRIDRNTTEGKNSGVGQVSPIVGPEVSPFDGVRDVGRIFLLHRGSIGRGGGSSVAAHIRSSEPVVGGQVTSPGWGNCGGGYKWSLNFPQRSFKKLPQPSERFLKTLSVVNGFEVERLLEYLAYVLKIRRLSFCCEPLAESLLAA